MEFINQPLLFLGNLGTTEIVIIAFIFLLLFGGKKIPELMKGIGKGVRSFKQGVSEIQEEINTPPVDEKKAEKKVEEVKK